MKAIWNDIVIAESEKTIQVEGIIISLLNRSKKSIFIKVITLLDIFGREKQITFQLL